MSLQTHNIECLFKIGDLAISTAPDAWGRWQVYKVLQIYKGPDQLSFELQNFEDKNYSHVQTINFEKLCIKTRLMVFGERDGYQWQEGTSIFWDEGIKGLVRYSGYPIIASIT